MKAAFATGWLGKIAPPADGSAKKRMTISPILTVRNRPAVAYIVIGGALPDFAGDTATSLAGMDDGDKKDR